MGILKKIIKLSSERMKKSLVFQAVLFAILSAVFSIIPPIIQKYLIDYLVIKDIRKVSFLIILLIVAVVMQLVINIRKIYLCSLFEEVSALNLCKKVVCGLFDTSYEKISNTDPDYLYNRIKCDSDNIVGFTRKVIENMIPNSLMFVCTLLYFVLNAPLLLLLLLFVIIFFITFYMLLQKKMGIAIGNYKELKSRNYSVFNQTLSNLSTIKINGWSIEESKRIEKSILSSVGAYKKFLLFTTCFLSIASSLQVILTLLVIVSGAFLISKGTLSIGDLFAMISFSSMIISPLISIVEILTNFPEMKVSLSRIQELEDIEKDIEGTIVLQNINEIDVKIKAFVYDQLVIDCPIVHHFEKGKLYIINGANGTGKSSFFNVLVKLHQSYDGNIIVNGSIDLKDVSTNSLCKLVSYVEQDNHLFSGTILENIFFGQNNGGKDYIPYILEGFLHSLYKLPNGLNEMIANDSISILSGGEKKKTALARALVKNSNLILLDEPTVALDKESIDSFFGILNKLKENNIIILVTHETIYNNYADEIITVERYNANV